VIGWVELAYHLSVGTCLAVECPPSPSHLKIIIMTLPNMRMKNKVYFWFKEKRKRILM